MARSHKIGHRLAEAEFEDDAKNLVALFTEYVRTSVHDSVVIEGEKPEAFEEWLLSNYDGVFRTEYLLLIEQAMDTMKIDY